MKILKFKTVKKYISAILAIAIMACLFCVSPVAAETVIVDRFGHVEGSDGEFIWTENKKTKQLDYFYAGEKTIENQIYCIDHTAALNNGTERDSIDCTLTSGSEYWMGLSDAARRGVLVTLLYGFNGKDNAVPADLLARDNSITTMDYLAATQFLIWEYTSGYRTAYNNCTNYIYYNVIQNRAAGKAYLYILEQTANHFLKASFLSTANNMTDAKTFNFKWNEENQRYEFKTVDENGFDFDWTIVSPDEISVERNGTEYTFYSEKPTDGKIMLRKTLKSGNLASTNEYSVFTFAGNSGQELISGKINPFTYFMKFTTEELATISLTKESDDNNVEGFTFKVSGANLKNPWTMITDENGFAELSGIKAGTYIISEVQKSLAYRVWNPITINIQNGMTNYDVFANNETAYGTVIVKKTSENGTVKGFDFTLSGKVYDGEGDELESTKDFTMTETTDANGEARFYVPVNKVVQGETTYLASREGFTITEADSPVYNEVNPITGVFVEDNQDVEIPVHNTLKKSNVIINVECEDNLVEGMEYKLHGFSLSGEEVTLEGTTDSNGRLVFEDVLVSDADGYTVEEVNVPVRYIEPEAQNIQVKYGEDTEITFVNLLRSVTVLISKVSNVGGAVPDALLAVYDSDNNKIYENRTDRAGMLEVKNLKVAHSYSVRELEAPEGYILNEEPIEFSINDDGTVSGTVVLVNQKVPVKTTPTPVPTMAPTPEPTLAPVPTVPPTPQTGDDSNIGTWAALFTVTLMAAGIAAVFAFKRKKEEK